MPLPLATKPNAQPPQGTNANPLISIALCTYNGARFLREQLDSLIVQDYSPLEIVVVDDGSTDATLQILKEYRQRDERIMVYRNPANLGFRKNFERAIELCKGDFIATCDQDDIWHSRKLTKLKLALGEHVLAYCDSELIDDQGNSLNLRASDLINMYEGNDPKAFVFYNCVSGHAMLFRRTLVAEAKPFPECGYHDWWLAFIAASIDQIIYIDECLVKYRQHPNTQTAITGRRVTRVQLSKGTNRHAKTARWLTALTSYKRCPEHQMLVKLHEAWLDRQNQFITPSLCKIMLLNRNSFFFMRKEPLFTRYTRSLRYFWGMRVKRLFHFQKHAYPDT